jgi:regulator of sirC expression with transglutaminase-like and TPR domain
MMHLDAALNLLAADPEARLDLAEVALLVARDEYSHLDVEAYLAELTGMAHELRPRLCGGLTARVQSLARYLFHEHGFSGNQRDYYDPRNSYLNEVLDRRTGLPITLAIVAMAVGGRAGLPVYGVALPGHFIAKAVLGDAEVLFDPFHEGRLLTPSDCERLVEQVTERRFEVTREVLAPAATRSIVQRVLTNHKGVYLRREDYGRAARVTRRLLQLAPGDPVQQRDLGVCLLKAEQPGRAIGPLQAYLAAWSNSCTAPARRWPGGISRGGSKRRPAAALENSRPARFLCVDTR